MEKKRITNERTNEGTPSLPPPPHRYPARPSAAQQTLLATDDDLWRPPVARTVVVQHKKIFLVGQRHFGAHFNFLRDINYTYILHHLYARLAAAERTEEAERMKKREQCGKE
jgi:hypothetical protein